MDLIKIGKYIADKRKRLGMTQRQLAEKIGMSDKSVSKWERGVCLPDVSVYGELCRILGISINEFLAGEDIPQEIIAQKTEENIISIATASKQKQDKLKIIICGLVFVSVLALAVIVFAAYEKLRPQNFIVPLEHDSIEMRTAELLFGPDEIHIYSFTTSDEYKRFRLYISEYHSGELKNKEKMELGFEGIGSPENGEILIVPDFENFMVRIIIAADNAKLSTELPILTDVSDREYYGRSATGISESATISYNEEQQLVALIYDDDEMWVPDVAAIVDGNTDAMAKNDYVYSFSFEFCKD